MKRLNLLKPNQHTVFLNGGKGQEVNYLYVPEEITLKVLEHDVNAGALQFKDAYELAKKKPVRVVFIDCNSKEEGLLAANYIAGVYNEVKCKEAFHDCFDDFDIPFEIEDEESVSYGDLEDDISDMYAEVNMQELEVSDFEFSAEDDGDDGLEEWEEHCRRVPIITMEQLTQYENMHFNSNLFSDNDVVMNGLSANPRKEPYWLGCTTQPVCILAEVSDSFSPFGGSCLNGLTKYLKRFKNNRHVYVVVVHEQEEDEDENENTVGVDNFYDYGFSPRENIRQSIYEAVLEYTASVIDVKCAEDELSKYHELVFRGWAPALGTSLDKNFPVEKICKQIISMRNPEKSVLMEKVYKYVLAQENVNEVLTETDFGIMKKFRLLGVADPNADGMKSIRKMEDTLIGMDEVKKQVYAIVDVMKYNKKRALRGMGNGGFHNVHLMIGAPGTAKTTIAQMMGNIMKEQKLLPGNRFISINGADLKGMYVGHSAPKTKAYFDNNDIILIDEAYSLTSEERMDSFSEEAIAQLIIELEKHGMDKLVIFAGYGGKDVSAKDNKMLQFLNANPGIRSRINSTIYFKSYTPEEMVDIAHCQAKNNNFRLTHKADELIYNHFAKRCGAEDFGNGREARSLVENISMEAACRVMRLPDSKQTKRALQELTLSDVKAALNRINDSYEMQNGKERRNCGFNMKGV